MSESGTFPASLEMAVGVCFCVFISSFTQGGVAAMETLRQVSAGNKAIWVKAARLQSFNPKAISDNWSKQLFNPNIRLGLRVRFYRGAIFFWQNELLLLHFDSIKAATVLQTQTRGLVTVMDFLKKKRSLIKQKRSWGGHGQAGSKRGSVIAIILS